MISFELAAVRPAATGCGWYWCFIYLFYFYISIAQAYIYIGTRLIEFKISRYTIGNLKKNLITRRPTLTYSIVCIDVCVYIYIVQYIHI